MTTLREMEDRLDLAENCERSGIVELYADGANWLGVQPCPKCGSRARWPTSAAHREHPRSVVCECGYVEKIAEE